MRRCLCRAKVRKGLAADLGVARGEGQERAQFADILRCCQSPLSVMGACAAMQRRPENLISIGPYACLTARFLPNQSQSSSLRWPYPLSRKQINFAGILQMRVLWALTFLFLPTLTSATPSWEDIRTLAYKNDVTAVENAMAQAHRMTLDGELTYDELRNLQKGFLTTHPHMIEFTSRWMQEYPFSPYAATVRAFQLNNAAWDMRGGGYVSETHPDALDAFYELREEGQRLARFAYTSARSYIPASDAFLVLEFANQSMADNELFAEVKRIMRETPNTGTLYRALRMGDPNWGGDGIRMVREYCANFASLISDIEGYTTDVCVADQIHWQGLQHDDYANFSYGVLERTNHPELEHVRRNLALERGTEADKIYLLDWLSESDNYNYTVARKYADKFALDDRATEVLQQMDQRLQDMALEALPHDPFSPKLIRILTRERPYYPRLRAAQHAEHVNYLKRLAVSKPYDEQTWMDIANHLETNHIYYSIADEIPFWENAIYYSYYDDEVLWLAQATMAETHTNFTNTKNFFELAGPAAFEGSEPEITESFLEEVEVFLEENVYCEIYRIKRFQEAICEWKDEDPRICLASFGPPFHEVIEIVEKRDICRSERFDALETLAYTPSPINVESLNVEMASE